MNKIYYLSTCSTCSRILKGLKLDGIKLIDIKSANISASDLDYAASKLGSYESLFSKRAMKYKSLGLNEMDLSETDYRNYILEEYTFLKRPVAFIDDEVFAGNSKKVVENLTKKING
jgi:arsenate reductase